MPRTRPLYRIKGAPLAARPLQGHSGLWYDKFCWQLGSGGAPDKRHWIDTVAGSVGADALIDEYAQRDVRLIEARGGRFAVFKTVSRFVTGLGRSHPVENGFAWHPTLGTPYLPGSSVKGMVRAWARAENGPEGEGDRLGRLLGDRDRSGVISFLDAVPTGTASLEADVMTPHYANWTVEDPPGDWRSPKPIPFLTVASGVTMLVGVLPRGLANAKDVATVMDWIARALLFQGAGAKTAVGYGQFEPDDDERARLIEQIREAERRATEERRRATLSPVQLEIEDLLDGAPGGQSRSVVLFQALEAGRWTGVERKEVLEWLKAEMTRDGTWQPTRKKPPKAHRRTIAVMNWLAER